MKSNSRIWFLAATVFFTIFMADILAAKIQVSRGANIPLHLGDTLQFILLLIAVTLFIIGTLVRERTEQAGNKSDHD